MSYRQKVKQIYPSATLEYSRKREGRYHIWYFEPKLGWLELSLAQKSSIAAWKSAWEFIEFAMLEKFADG